MGIKQSVTKNMYYRRAHWDGIDKNTTLELHLITAHHILKTPELRSFDLSNGLKLEGAKIEQNKDGIFFHIVTYFPNQSTSTINKDKSSSSSEISEEPAPEGKDYLEGDIFVMVKDNHVILCPSGARESMAINYFRSIIRKYDKNLDAHKLELSKIADSTKLNLIKKEGVKEIQLSSSLYHASLIDLEKTQSTPSNLLSSVSSQLKSIFSKDPTLKQISELENINVEISLKFDGVEGRKKHQPLKFGEAGRDRLLKTAELLLDDNDDEEGFLIVTGQGNKISAGEIRIADSATINKIGKSLSSSDAWDKLQKYYEKLKSTGVLSQ